jgi:hypothetical protein
MNLHWTLLRSIKGLNQQEAMIWLKVWQDETKWVEGLVEHVNII